MSEEQFEKAKASLKGDAVTQFFEFDFAAQNNPNVVATANGRDENEDALRALCVELIAQNQQYNFASELISRVGYPMWSRSMFYTNSGQNAAPAVVLPFSQLNDDSTRAFIYATPIDNYWYLRLVTRHEVDSLLSNAPNSDNLHFKVGMLGKFDKLIFDNPTVRYANFIFGYGLTTHANDRCTWVHSAVIICAPDVAITNNDPAGDRGDCITIEYFDCVTYGGGMGGGNGSSWFNGGGGLGQGNGQGGYGWGGGASDPYSDPFGGASVAFIGQWQAYLGTLEPDGGNQQGSNLTQGEIDQFDVVFQLNELGLFSYGQLQTAFNNINLAEALVALLQANPGDPNAQQVASGLLSSVAAGMLNEAQALTLLDLYNTLELSVEQVGWLAANPNVIEQVDNFVTAYPNADNLQEGMHAHINLCMSTQYAYLDQNANANFPAIGTEAWANTLVLEDQGGYPMGGFFDLKPAEKLLAVQHPPTALVINENKTIARQKQAAFWGWGGINVTWLGKGDAFLHTYFQAINTQAVGPMLTQQFADAHETEHPQVLYLETEMDLFNNSVGINIGIGNASLNIHAMADFVNNSVFDGACKYLDPVDHTASPPYVVGCSNCLNGILPNTTLKWTDQ